MNNSQLAQQSSQQFESLLQQVIEEAKKQGATAAEVALGIESGLSVTARLGDVETIEYHHDKGIGITVYIGQSKGSSNTSDFSEKSLREAVAAACGIARHTAKDQWSGLPERDDLAWKYPDLDLNHPWDVSADQAVEIALECETAAREYDKRITNSEGATLNSHSGLHYYSNSLGFVGHYPTTRHSLSCSVIGQDGGAMQRDYWYSVARDNVALDSAASVGKTAAQRTVARLNGKRLSTRKAPVVFVPEMAAGFIGHFLRAIRGGSLYRKTSFLLDSLGQQLFPEWLDISERPHIKGSLGSAPFDNEGVKTQDRELVESGVLKSYLLDSYAARRLGMHTTGHAGGVHNLVCAAGDLDQQGLLRKMNTGLLVTELMGQGVNAVTGDYSRGAAGFWVENGEIQFPVEEITIAGNLKEMFKNVVAIGNDVDRRRNIQTGSIMLEQMTIAGE